MRSQLCSYYCRTWLIRGSRNLQAGTFPRSQYETFGRCTRPDKSISFTIFKSPVPLIFTHILITLTLPNLYFTSLSDNYGRRRPVQNMA